MLTSFYTALSGLGANSQAINVIGNNLANINTTAFKGSRTMFAELLGGISYSSDGNPIQTGLGAISAGVSPLFTQGSIMNTGRSTDAAVSGNGFFIVSTGTGYAYTRAGNFSINGMGELVSGEGFKVAGYMATGGVISPSAPLGPITIQGNRSLPPQATTTLGITANLDSQTAANATFATAVQVYDSLGSAHTVTFTFTKTGPTDWSWDATIPAVDTGGLATAPPVSIGTGNLTFNSAGVLTAPATNPTLAVAGLANGASNLNITFGVLDPSGNPRLTGNAAASAVSSVTQDGYAPSSLRDLAIDADGVIRGIYDNGQVHPLAQLGIANFNNPEGLLKFTGNTFVEAFSSGAPSVGVARTGGRGTVNGSALELSNVDIAEQFTGMIISQRGYQANSRVITTTDELYQEAINLKR
ncbi:MAG: flagellar hook protein FlgE [Acidobacteriia bacterium]|nr:flagellar hook protein FlgE [Terriglobia bacterium]